MFITLLLAQVALQSQPGIVQEPIRGAKADLQRIATFHPPILDTKPFAKAQADAAELAMKLDKLSPEQATDAWMALLKEWEDGEARSRLLGWGAGADWGEVMMTALPKPATWPLIRERLTKLPPSEEHQAAVALFDDLLGRDRNLLPDRLSPRKPDGGSTSEDLFSPSHKILEAERRFASTDDDLEALEKVYIHEIVVGTFRSGDGLPDIVGRFGQGRATHILQQILGQATTSLDPFNGVQTQELARSIVLSDIAILKVPQWGMVRGLDDFVFVAAQVARFGEKALVDSGPPQRAAWIYALGLAKKGDLAGARRVVDGSPIWYGNLESFVGGEAKKSEVFDLVGKLLGPKPDDKLWNFYRDLGLSLGRRDELITRLSQWVSDPGLDVDDRATYVGQQANLDWDSGQTRRAISEFEQATKLRPSGFVYPLLSIATATGDHQALDVVAEAAKALGTEGSRLDLFDAYLAQGRITDAQTAVLTAARDVHNVNLSAEGQGHLHDAYPQTGLELAELYFMENQPSEIITLLHEYPSWGAGDLQSLVNQQRPSDYEADLQAKPLGFYAAWALAKTGKKQTAIRVLHALIPYDRADDAAYELLNQVEGAGASGLYDALIRSGPLEPLPLIWKGELLLRIGRPRDAERTLRAAIALGPSGDPALPARRPFAYEVLGRVLKAKGDRVGSAECAQVVTAGRLTALADKAADAKEFTKAVELYRRALALFPSDMRAQEHLADSLESLGRRTEASAAVQRALELIPSNQGPAGRVHPMEDASFRSQQDTELARATLDKVMKASPLSPGVWFALGQLDWRTGDQKAALTCFEEAVKNEPRFVAAWQAIANHAPDEVATKKQLQDAVLAMIRLAPDEERASLSRGVVAFGDKSVLWLAYNQAYERQPPLLRGPLLTLEASKRSLAAGSHAANPPNMPEILRGPGAELSEINELKGLFP